MSDLRMEQPEPKKEIKRRGRPTGVVLRASMIRQCRVHFGLTQEDLANAIRVSPRTICSVERQQAVSMRTARALADLFSTTVGMLILQDGEKPLS